MIDNISLPWPPGHDMGLIYGKLNYPPGAERASNLAF